MRFMRLFGPPFTYVKYILYKLVARQRQARRDAAATAQAQKDGKTVYVGINIYIAPEQVRRLRIVKRYVLHGILASWGWKLTKGLLRKLFIQGGVFRVRCKASDIADIQDQIEL